MADESLDGIGIVDFEVRLPGGRVTVERMSAESGLPAAEIWDITRSAAFPILGAGELSWELAAAAAGPVLTRTGVPRDRIGQVIFAGSAEWDVPFWSPAAKIADVLGIGSAHCFEVANFCNASTVALRIAVDAIAAGRCEYVLVLVADRLSRLVDYRDPGSKALFNFGDAAAAVLVGAGGAYALRHSAMRTDPSWADYYAGRRVDGGVTIERAAHQDGLAEAYVENFGSLVKQTLVTLDIELDDIAYFLINHGDQTMHERLLHTLGMPRSRSVFNYGRLAHMGGADTLIALRELTDQGRLNRGDLVMLATSAMGFSWGITTIERTA